MENIKSMDDLNCSIESLENSIKKLKRTDFKLKLLNYIKNNVIEKKEREADKKDESKDRYSMFNLDDLTSALAMLISICENKEYVVEKACYISTSKKYMTSGNYYISIFQFDALLIVNKNCVIQPSEYYNYYVDEMLESRDVILINRATNARDTKNNLIGYNGYYDGTMKLQFKDRYNFSGNGIISIRKDAFYNFEYAYEFIEYLIDKRVQYRMTDLPQNEIYKFMNQFLKEKTILNKTLENTKIS